LPNLTFSFVRKNTALTRPVSVLTKYVFKQVNESQKTFVYIINWCCVIHANDKIVVERVC